MHRKNILAAVAAATAVVAPGTAAVASAPTTTTVLLGTYSFGRAQVIGTDGLANGAWTAFSVRSGIAGDDLVVTYRPRVRAIAERPVYTAAFDEVTTPRTECEKVGADGLAHHVWVSFRCRTGWAPSYTLLVR